MTETTPRMRSIVSTLNDRQLTMLLALLRQSTAASPTFLIGTVRAAAIARAEIMRRGIKPE